MFGNTVINKICPALIFGMTLNLWAGQWVKQTVPGQWNVFNSIHFINKDIGWAAGSRADSVTMKLVKTLDGGATWSIQFLQSFAELRAVYFVNADVGWVAGERYPGAALYKTVDGGATWTDQNPGANWFNINSLFFLDSTAGWAVGDRGTILKTTDGGNTWLPQDLSDFSLYYARVYFVDRNKGFAVVSENYSGELKDIAKTTDGGLTWTTQFIGEEYYGMRGVHFADANTGWVVGENGMIFKTSDGGDTWMRQNSGTTANLRSVRFVNQDIGWVVGYNAAIMNSTILMTEDGGKTWISQNQGILGDLYDVFFHDAGNGWVTGQGLIYKYDPTATPSIPRLRQNLLALAPDGSVFFQLLRPGLVSLQLIDSRGRLTLKLVDGRMDAGDHRILLPSLSSPHYIDFRGEGGRRTLMVPLRK